MIEFISPVSVILRPDGSQSVRFQETMLTL